MLTQSGEPVREFGVWLALPSLTRRVDAEQSTRLQLSGTTRVEDPRLRVGLVGCLVDVGETDLDFDDFLATLQERVQDLRIEVAAASVLQEGEAFLRRVGGL